MRFIEARRAAKVIGSVTPPKARRAVVPSPAPVSVPTTAPVAAVVDEAPADAVEVKATAAAVALAAELGVDLSAVTGTGKEGRVTADDVRKAAP